MSDQRPNATPPSTGFDLNRPTIVDLLYLASIITGVTAIIGIVLAYVWKNDSHEPWEATHYIYQIRTFWIGLAGTVIGLILLVILIGGLILLGTGIWVLVRTALSLVNAQKRAPMPNPETLPF
jgi:uncharacterized membrane protein